MNKIRADVVVRWLKKKFEIGKEEERHFNDAIGRYDSNAVHSVLKGNYRGGDIPRAAMLLGQGIEGELFERLMNMRKIPHDALN